MAQHESTFGKRLRSLRIAAALSQEDLAERSGLSRRGISDLERGARLAPRLETVRLLADALQLTMVDRAQLLTAAQSYPATRTIPSQTTATWTAMPVLITRLILRDQNLEAV